MRLLVVCCLAACGPKAPPPKPPPLLENVAIVVHAKRLLDVETGIYLDDAMIAIRDDRIAFTGNWERARVPDNVEIVELGDSVLMPGLVDAHVHLAWSNPQRPPDGIPGAAEAEATLRAGVTTVRNLGSTGRADFALRDAIASGQIIGPRMQIAGPGLGAPGGACDRVFGGEGRVKTAAEAQRVVDDLATAGATVIKICTGGGVIPAVADRDVVELEEAMVRAIVEAAAARGLKVAAHAEGPKAIGAAVRGGVASIEHGGLVELANVEEMKVRGTVLVPTLARIDHALANAASPSDKAALAASRKLAYESVKRAVAAGVAIAMGTDATVIPHGQNARELAALVEVGLEPAAAIRAATLDAARLMGVHGEIGSLTAGKRADIIAVKGDPLRNVGAVRDVVFVMKAGDVIRNDLR